jgi:hypothetical protein
LTDVFPEARDLLYYFLDAPGVLTPAQLADILNGAGIDPDSHEKVTDFLWYYGVLGSQIGDNEYFIFAVNYDLKVLKIKGRARQRRDALYREPRFLAGIRHSRLGERRARGFVRSTPSGLGPFEIRLKINNPPGCLLQLHNSSLGELFQCFMALGRLDIRI